MFRINLKGLAIAGLCMGLVAGCEAPTANPVIFGQGTSLGITLGQSSTTQAPEFALGYRDQNIAYLPTVAVDEKGRVIPIGGAINSQTGSFNETYSVLGQFELGAEAKENVPAIALGKFFATGNAAVKLSAGFACGISDGKDSTHCHKP